MKAEKLRLGMRMNFVDSYLHETALENRFVRKFRATSPSEKIKRLNQTATKDSRLQ